MAESKADAWEKAEMMKIKERYELLIETIVEWEKKKKEKAKKKLIKTEEELERKRAKAKTDYESELMRIDEIAGGARAQTEEKWRNDEFKAKEKANKIRIGRTYV